MRVLLIFTLLISNILTAELPHTKNSESVKSKGKAASEGYYESVAMSMMLWGLGIGTSAALLAAFLQGSRADTAHSHAHTHS